MRQRTLMASTAVVLSCFPSGTLLGQGPGIEHDPVGCVQADRYPRLTARLSGEAARARVYFRASGTAAWYFVEMKPEAGSYAATLPKPEKSTKGFDYYIEALDTAMTQSRTADFSPVVVSGDAGCGSGKAMAAVASSASVVVGVPAGAPAVPAGFASSGVVSAGGAGAGAAAGAAGGGGLSTGLLVGLAAAGAAGVGVAVASAGGGTEDNSGGPSSSGIHLNIEFTPGIDVSVCGAISFGSQGVTLRADGSFDETWSPTTPNVLRVQGRADASSLQATLTCAARSGPTGSLAANGSNYSMTGTFSFGNAAPTPNTASQGTIRVQRQ